MSDSDSYYSAQDSELSFNSFSDSSNDIVHNLQHQLNNIFSTSNNFLNICHINAQSIPRHFSEFESSFSSTLIHAILISESWLKPSLPSSLYPLPGYTLIRNDRVGKRGGGVAIYLLASIPHKIILRSHSEFSGTSEHLFVEIGFKGTRMILGVVYCPPSVDYFAGLETALDSICAEYTHCVIMGDFNTDVMKNTHRSIKLQTIIESVNLTILPLMATHHNVGTNDSLIDLILTASPGFVKTHGQVPAPGFSRHDLIYASYKLKPPKSSPSILHLRSFSRMDYDKLSVL